MLLLPPLRTQLSLPSCNEREVIRNKCSIHPRTCSISFGTIEIREYNRVLVGDPMNVSHALAIGWEYEQHPAVPLGAFEQEQQYPQQIIQQDLYSHLRRQKGVATRQCRAKRWRILNSFGYTRKELAQAEKERQRMISKRDPRLAKDDQDVTSSSHSSFILPLRFFRLQLSVVKPLLVNQAQVAVTSN